VKSMTEEEYWDYKCERERCLCFPGREMFPGEERCCKRMVRSNLVFGWVLNSELEELALGGFEFLPTGAFVRSHWVETPKLSVSPQTDHVGKVMLEMYNTLAD